MSTVVDLMESRGIQFLGQEIQIPAGVEFWKVARKELSDLWERVPDDGSVKLCLKRDGKDFRIDLGVVSSAIAIAESDVAKSPFVAFERALTKVYHTLNIWKLGRRF